MNLERILAEHARNQAALREGLEAVDMEHHRRVSDALRGQVEPVVVEACATLRRRGQEVEKHVHTISATVDGRPEALVMSVTLEFGGHRCELCFRGGVDDLTVTAQMDCPERPGLVLRVPARLPVADVTQAWTGAVVEHFVCRVLGVVTVPA